MMTAADAAVTPEIDACPEPAALALFVAGAATPAEAAAVESHVDRCARCAARLSAEAQLEVRLWHLGAAAAVRRVAQRRREDVGARLSRLLPRGRTGRLALLLTAAAVVLAVVPRPVPSPALPSREPDDDPGAIAAFEPADRAPLVVEPVIHELSGGREHRQGVAARRAGVFVNYHGAMGSFPHFEMSAPGRRRRARAMLDNLDGDLPEPTAWPVSLTP